MKSGFKPYSPFSNRTSGSLKIIDKVSRNVIHSLERVNTEQQKSFAKLFFYSPELKTLELDNFPILSEVAISGNIVECEKGYRSEKIEARKLFLLVNFFELNEISKQLGQYLNKDNAEAIHSTIVWLDFLNNYLKSISKLYGCSFEMRVNVNKNNPIDSNLFNPPDWDNGYLSFEKDLYINERLRGIADTVLISNKLLKILEVPSRNTYFLLVAEQLELLLPTLASRCQILKLKPLLDETIENKLSAIGKSEESKDLISDIFFALY